MDDKSPSNLFLYRLHMSPSNLLLRRRRGWISRSPLIQYYDNYIYGLVLSVNTCAMCMDCTWTGAWTPRGLADFCSQDTWTRRKQTVGFPPPRDGTHTAGGLCGGSALHCRPTNAQRSSMAGGMAPRWRQMEWLALCCPACKQMSQMLLAEDQSMTHECCNCGKKILSSDARP